MAAVTFDLTSTNANGDYSIPQGSSYKIRLRPSSPNWDMTGAVMRSQIRKSYSDPHVMASFTVDSGVDVDGVWFDLILLPEQTAAIAVNASSSYRKKSTFFCYDAEIELADGTVERLIEGIVEVTPEVTK